MTETRHIRHMLQEASGMAAHAQGHVMPTIEWKGREYTTVDFLNRAANLAAHAGQELTDEAMLAHGFPGV